MTRQTQNGEGAREADLLADAMPQLVWTALPDGTVDYYSARYKEFKGIERLPDGSWKWDMVLHPDDLAPTVEAWNRSVAGGVPYEIEHRVCRADGQMRWYLSRAMPSLDLEGRVRKWYGTTTDIDRGKRAQEFLKVRLKLSQIALGGDLEALLQHSLDAAELFTQSSIGFFHFVDADEEVLSLQTWSTNTLRLMCTAEGKGSHYPVSLAGVWADCVKTRAPVIHNDYEGLAHKKGLPTGHAPVTRELVVPLFQQERIVAIIGVGNKATHYSDQDVEPLRELGSITMDLAGRIRLEKALAVSEHRFRAIADYTVDWENWLGPGGELLWVNPAVEKVTGYKAAESEALEDFPYCLFIEGDREKVRALHRQVCEGATCEDVELRITCKDGSHKWVSLSLQPICDASGANLGSRSSLRDITARKQLEEEREGLISNLNRAIEEIKVLEGIIPICASCKKVRDDEGYWTQVDAYITKRTDALFSHGICPDCIRRLYPEFAED